MIEHVLRLGLRYRIMLTGSGNETPHRKWREIDITLGSVGVWRGCVAVMATLRGWVF